MCFYKRYYLFLIELQIEQRRQEKAPYSTQQTDTSSIKTIAENNRNKTQEFEQTFKMQVQPFLQTFLDSTRQSYPTNIVINMSNGE